LRERVKERKDGSKLEKTPKIREDFKVVKKSKTVKRRWVEQKIGTA